MESATISRLANNQKSKHVRHAFQPVAWAWMIAMNSLAAIAPGYMRTAHTTALQADPERSQEILACLPAAR